MNIVRMQDLSAQYAEELGEPYGDDSTEFREFLRTLGLRTYAGLGENKNAYDIVSESAAVRGW